ncbi:MAG TPA: tRNA (guanosine(46)-N7)-methyltransferase TrmB [Acholeplasma sp.]|nr:tRNA (guanosine(46)-N7)-methyltransferase TrmB [Acholeplasma sp.]
MRIKNIKDADLKLLEFKDYYIAEPNKYKGKWNELFKNNNPIHLEIGMGKGKFLKESAVLNPNINYIGIEKSNTVLLKAARMISKTKLENIYLLSVDANNLLDYFASLEVSKIYLNFSDPWPKERHAKRRLTAPHFLRQYLDILVNEGVLELKTDNENLFNYSLSTLSKTNFIIKKQSTDFDSKINDSVETEYEQKFKEENKNIYYIKAVKMTTKKRMKLYEDLTNLNGPSGDEGLVKEYLLEEYKKETDEILRDGLGSVFGVKRGKKDEPVIMIAGHMDEVGGMVTRLQENGFIKFINIGGVVPHVWVSQNVVIETTKGKVKGVVASVPPHMGANGEIKVENLFIDVGAESKKDLEKWGIKPGDFLTFENDYYITKNKNRIVSKAWDNRFGTGMALEVFRELKNISHPNTVICGATVQEEVGLRGAKTSSQMVEPDLFIALDVSPVGDATPGPGDAFGKLNGGFLIRFYDPRNIMNPKMLEYVEGLAKKHKIDYQFFLSMGGTDAAIAQYAGSGCFSITIGLPGRYIHSNTSMIDVRDVEAVKAIVLEIIKDFSKERLLELKK